MLVRHFASAAKNAVKTPRVKGPVFVPKGSTKVGPIGGRLIRNMDKIPVIHASQRPAFKADIDYESLGLTYKMNLPVNFVVERHAWAPKPDTTPNLPFEVERSSIGGALPIYTDYVAGGTKVITILRKCKGDIEILKSEMEKVCETEVEVRPGKLVVAGNFDRRLKTWLTGLGF